MGLKENIKAKRQECGFTLEEVAKHIGIGKQTVQKYESGLVSNIPSDKIEKMAQLFNVSPAQLMGWDEESAATTDDNAYNLTDIEKQIIDVYRSLDRDKASEFVFHLTKLAQRLDNGQ